jgi:hypothetical protein
MAGIRMCRGIPGNKSTCIRYQRKLGDDDIQVSKLTDDQKDELAQITYNGYMRVLACIAQKEMSACLKS